MAYQNKLKVLLAQSAYSLVELLMAIAIFGVLTTILFTGFIATRDGKPQQAQRIQAAVLHQESIEALRIVREQAWDNIANNGTFHPEQTADSWALVGGGELIDESTGLTRSIQIDDVYRDQDGNITDIGGTLDPSTKAVSINIEWTKPLLSSYNSTIYLSRYLDNLAFTDTTPEDFTESGYLINNVQITEEEDGEIKLVPAGAGHGNWCEPGEAWVNELDLPKNGEARAITAIEGKIFTGTGLNASGVSLAYVTSDNQNPPNTTVAGTIDGYKTNDVFGTDNHGFLATDTNNEEVVIVDLNNIDPNTKVMNLVGYYDVPGNTDADSIFISGPVGYVTANNNLYSFDVLNIIGSSSQTSLDNITLGETGLSVYVVGDIAYVAMDSSSDQLKIVDVSNPSEMSVLASLTVNGAEGRDVYVSEDGNRAYLVTKGDSAKAEFFIINTEDKSNPSVLGSYDTNGMDPKAVDVILEDHLAIVVGVGGEEYQVIVIVPDNNPTYCGGMTGLGGVYDVATVVENDGDAYAYINSAQSDSELKVIEGGPGGAPYITYETEGQYESAPFEASFSTAFNRMSFNADVPEETTLSFQVAGAPLGSNGCSDASYHFVGPDGSDSSFFSNNPIIIPFNNQAGEFNNPALCFKYKAFFTTNNILVSPILKDITVNYSP
jgi:prepilin-type N-terminal cleavage/methylation domain-containing protein